MKRIIALTTALLMLWMCAAWAEEEGVPAEPTETVEATAEAEATDAPDESTEVPASSDVTVALPEEGGLPDPEVVEALTTEEPPAEPVAVWFEEGFGLTLPAGWMSYDVSDADRAAGLRYILGDGSGERWLYIQITPTAFADAAALTEAVEDADELTKPGELVFDGAEFVTFIDTAQNASCCATLWGESLAMFAFTPQNDSDFMLTATQIMETFATA